MEATAKKQTSIPTQWIGSIEFLALDSSNACSHIIELAGRGIARHIHLANAYTISLAENSPVYKDTLSTPALNFADGRPISWVSKARQQLPRLTQVRGPELFLAVLDKGRKDHLRHFLLGSSPEVLATMKSRLLMKFPDLLIVGSESPPFRPMTSVEHDEQDSRIRDSGAQIVWVGLGTPKQDFEAYRIAQHLPVVAVAVGAAFDFTAGTSREAPKWMTSFGVEWLFRLICEPKRLWRRYLIGNIQFLKIAVSKTNKMK